MYYLPLALITLALAPWIIDRTRLDELSIYGLLGAVLSTAQDRLMLIYPLWEYADVGLFNTHTEIAFLISLSAAPLAAMRFAQKLGAPFPWGRAMRFTLVSMIPELIGLTLGKITYHQWWTVAHSFAAYAPIWCTFWLLHRYLNRGSTRSSTTAQLK